MSPSMIDMWLIILQLLAVCGGLIVIGCLTVKIVKNRRPENRIADPPAVSFSETLINQLVEQRFQKAVARDPVLRERDAPRPGPVGRPPADRNDRRHAESARMANTAAFSGSKAKGRPLDIRFRQAARLAARGVDPDTIQRTVELPRCEIDLIARLNDPYAAPHWGEHGPLLAAIEAAG